MSRINKITIERSFFYVTIVYGARQRITNTRNFLGIGTNQTYTVVEYCKYDGISLDDFDTLAK
jgi:hypothetical protein